MESITLNAGGAGLEVAPAAGGAVARYWLDRGGATWEWLRPAPAGAPRPRRSLRRGGRVSTRPVFEPYPGRAIPTSLDATVVLPVDLLPPERHSIHGHGWQTRWTPLDREREQTALFEYRPRRTAPGRGRTGQTQRFVLTPASLTVELTLRQ